MKECISDVEIYTEENLFLIFVAGTRRRSRKIKYEKKTPLFNKLQILQFGSIATDAYR